MSKYLLFAIIIISQTASLLGYSSTSSLDKEGSGKVQGIVKNQDEVPLTGVSIFAKGTYDGTTCLLYTSPSPRD